MTGPAAAVRSAAGAPRCPAATTRVAFRQRTLARRRQAVVGLRLATVQLVRVDPVAGGDRLHRLVRAHRLDHHPALEVRRASPSSRPRSSVRGNSLGLLSKSKFTRPLQTQVAGPYITRHIAYRHRSTRASTRRDAASAGVARRPSQHRGRACCTAAVTAPSGPVPRPATSATNARRRPARGRPAPETPASRCLAPRPPRDSPPRRRPFPSPRARCAPARDG